MYQQIKGGGNSVTTAKNKMITISTILGNVEVSEASMTLASGYGQYTILIKTIFERNSKTLNIHSTDSQLFDKLTDLDSNNERLQYLMEQANYIIESAIEDYIYSL